jgi:hypothetical protein
MTRLVWGVGSGISGLDHGVFFSKLSSAEVWNGLISVETTEEGSDERVQYLDGTVFQKRRFGGDFSGVLKAYTYPDSLYDDVLVQTRNSYFGMSWQINTGTTHEIHIVYNVLLLPVQQEHVPTDPAPFQWDFTTSPVVLPDARRSAHLIIDTDIAETDALTEFTDILYGTTVADPRLPLPDEIFAIFEAHATLIVTYYEDGSADIEGPAGVLDNVDPTTWTIDWVSVVKLDSITYEISSF